MSRRTALIMGASALAGAAVVGLVLLGVSLLGDDDEGNDPRVEQLEVAAKTADTTTDLAGIAGSIADGEGVSKRIEDVRNDTTNLLGRASTLEGDASGARSLERANEANLDAATELESIDSEISDARSAIDEEQLASEEASERLAGLSSSIEGLGDPIATAERRASSGLSELEQALATMKAGLEDSDELSEDAEAQLATVEQNLRSLDRQLRQAFAALTASAESLSGELGDRSVELEPDVVLDCPELSETMGAGLFEVSVRNMTCAEAGSLLGEFGPPAGFACTELESGYEYTVYRCTSGDRAIRYGVGA